MVNPLQVFYQFAKYVWMIVHLWQVLTRVGILHLNSFTWFRLEYWIEHTLSQIDWDSTNNHYCSIDSKWWREKKSCTTNCIEITQNHLIRSSITATFELIVKIILNFNFTETVDINCNWNNWKSLSLIHLIGNRWLFYFMSFCVCEAVHQQSGHQKRKQNDQNRVQLLSNDKVSRLLSFGVVFSLMIKWSKRPSLIKRAFSVEMFSISLPRRLLPFNASTMQTERNAHKSTTQKPEIKFLSAVLCQDFN